GYGKMVVNVKIGDEKHNLSELLDWLSDILHTSFSQVEHTCSGAAFCQLMNIIHPGSIDINKVKFTTKETADILDNYRLLQEAFSKAQIKKVNILKTLDLLTWFKYLYDHNVSLKSSREFENSKKEEQSSRLYSTVQTKYQNQKMLNVKRGSHESFFRSPATMCFIKKYGSSTSPDAGSNFASSKDSLVLGQKCQEDITAFCSQTPYCLYLYHGVELEDENKASVLLLGFFDKVTGENKFRLLDVLHPEEETADAICTCIVEMLKKFRISLMNMAIFYSDFPDHEGLLSGLKLLKPETVSLCGLTDMAGRVCHSGVENMEFSGLILNLITEIYKHFPTFPDALQTLLEDVDCSNFRNILTSQCSLFWRIIQKMTLAWSDLEDYFGSLDADGKEICRLLSDPKIRLNVLFLSHALQPLCDFQENIDRGVSVTQLLQDASQLVRFYTASFLRPKAAEFFLRRGKTSLIQAPVGHLPRGEVEVGKQAADFLLQRSEELTDYLETFQSSIISFYTTVTVHIIERLPFSDSILRNLSLVLSPGKKLEVTGKIVQDLGVRFGVCSGPENVSLLTDEFLEYQFIDGGDTHLADQSTEQYWKTELRIIGWKSSFGKLIVSLLALPRTLKKEIIFEQGREHSEHLSSIAMHCQPSRASKYDSKFYTSKHLKVWFVCVWLSVSQMFQQTDYLKERKMEDFEEKDMAEDDVTDSSSYKSAPSHLSPETQESIMSGNEMYIYFDGHAVGEMVWGPIEGFGLWPGLVQSWDSKRPCGSMRKVIFFGNRLLSEIQADDLLPFFSFAKCFCSNSFATVMAYKDAIFYSLQVRQILLLVLCSSCANMQFTDSKDELLRVMLDWAFGGFEPLGPEGLQPQSVCNGMQQAPEGFCLSCGSMPVEIIHPLFEGRLCSNCKYNFTETLYRYDEDGYQSYCTVCCSGMEVILCGHDNCCRSYCVDCLDILVGEGTFDRLKNVDPWTCYLCAPESSSRALKPRNDWRIRVQEFFANNSAMEFEPHRVYPSIPANQRRPIRVLSLFDGIATGYLVLRDLGFKVEKYVASEVDEESITISMVNHDGKITHVDDVKNITKKHIDRWGPFDLLIGGSPCNDLSIVNPARKGLFEGTGRLFFEYYRLLNVMKPKEDDPQPFFWLFENVVFMETQVKADICRFLECNPVLVNAVKVSPAHRARYFWGNIPGMNRPIIASQNDKLTLQECLEPGRTAKYEKVRTITTRTNSLKQGANDAHFPITANGKDDNIWITEMEKIFGFPKHYTDVKNMGRLQRQRVLGKSWSVPVIRHLLAPLKDYFACDEVPLK
uniref:DNA (cytosine-5-)-methyltransferase n=1 Tax=Cyprinus carpio TaxID=7962 RepID=A0A8C1VYZ3_CYPCA